MSTPSDLLADLLVQGAELWIEDGKLKVRAADGVLPPERLETLRRHKDEILRLLPEFRFEAPLSAGQEGLWYIQKSAPDSTAYNVSFAVRIESDGDPRPALRRALQRLVNRHSLLRTTYAAGDGSPRQIIHGYRAVDLTEVDATCWSSAETLSAAAAVHQRPFDLEAEGALRVYLFRQGPRESLLLLCVHHIAADGWSFRMLVEELLRLYEADGQANPLPPVNRTYQQYVRWQRDMLAARGEELRRAWVDELEGAPLVLNLPIDKARPARQTFRGATRPIALAAPLVDGLRALARDQGTTLSTMFLAALQVLLHRYSGQEDFCVGSAAAGRDHEEFASVLGYMVNTIALRARISAEAPPDFLSLLRQTHERLAATLDRVDYPFPWLVRDLRAERDPSRSPVVQAALDYQRTQSLGDAATGLLEGAPVQVGGARFTRVLLPQVTSELELILQVSEHPDRLDVGFRYNSDLFEASTIDRMAGHLQTLLAGIVSEPSSPVTKLPLLTEAEREQQIVAWNRTRAPFSSEACIHQLFEAHADRAPDAIALVDCCGRAAGSQGAARTYRELDRRANQVAHGLLRLGVGPETLVGLHLERGADLIVGLLGILKAGGAFVVLDPEHPERRLSFMLEDTGVSVLLTRASLLASLPETRARAVDLDRGFEGEPAHRPESGVGPKNLAYVLYTSGSTGQPKGVQIEHRGLVNSIEAAIRILEAGPGTSLSHVLSFNFDGAIANLFWMLCAGGALYLAPRDGDFLGKGFIDLMEREAITHALLPPAMLAALPDAELPALHTLVTAGEACSAELVTRWGRKRRFINMYGPTEVSILATYARCAADGSTPPIGRPIANLQAYVMDRGGQLAPAGVPGELYLGGVGVARGYLNRPELTAERFVDDPFTPGAKLYRTGDLCRHRPDGTLEFLGRIDHQVKIRGYRIELGEIEATLSTHPAVQACVALAREDAPGDKRLVAYVVLGGAQAPASELRDHLRKALPEHMVPSAFVVLPALPLTTSGKVDRSKLPAPTAAVRSEAAPAPTAPRSELERAIQAIWQDVLQVESVGITDNFFDIGGHSLLLARVRALLQKELGRELSFVELFEHPTIASLARHLAPAPEVSAPALPTPRRGTVSSGAVAIIGLAGRFPGAKDVDELWQNLAGGVEGISFFTDEELEAAGLSPRLFRDPSYIKAKGVLKEADLFDAPFFSYSPREAAQIDPQHRVFLECAWEAMEGAGYVPGEGARIAVFAGASSFKDLRGHAGSTGDFAEVFQAAYGAGVDFLATRVSYKLNLKGPSLTVQTGCSTSLVAVHLACRSLLDGDCDMALAGGVSVTLPLVSGYPYQEGLILSPDGHCRAFDEKAQGTLPGNGVGIVLLKRLEDALADGDTIHAVIRGSAINNDGSAKIGYTAPSVTGQAEVIARALAAANVGAEDIGYVEAHGTGTALGDPIEVAALTRVFRQSTDRRGFCAIGSVKTNIGHLDSAAGVAGLLKAVLSLKHRQIPPSLHFERPNPSLELSDSPFYVSTQLADWPSSGQAPRRAGVSSFGIGGTNVHVVLEEAPAVELAPAAERSAELFVVSAKSEAALSAQAARLGAHLEAHPELGLGDVALSLATTRAAMEHRLAVSAATREGLRAALAAAAQGEAAPGVVRGRVSAGGGGKVVFVFPGQGSQWVGMGQKLLAEEPVFRATLEACDRAIQAEAGWSLLAELGAGEAASQLGRIDVVQPALFAMEVALAALWRSWGIEPDAVVGHSMGEVAAAHVAGALSLEDAVAIICRRSRLLRRISGQGEMAVVELSLSEAEAALTGYEERLSVAVSNSPRSTVVAGEPSALAEVLARLEGRGVFCRRVKVDVASHSPQVDPLREDLLAELTTLRPRAAAVAMRSTVTGAMVAGPELLASYWADNLRQPVRFADAVQALLDGGHEVFVEMSPHPLLVPAVEEIQRAVSRGGVAVGSLRRGQGERPALLEALGALWARGHAVAWKPLFAGGGRRVPLPTYAWQRERYWIEAAAGGEAAQGRRIHAGGHPLLGEAITVSTQAGLRLWETTLDLRRLPWLGDHRIQGTAVFPGTGYLEMALASGAEVLGEGPLEVSGVVLAQALAFAGDAAVPVQVVTNEEQPGRLRFQVASLAPGDARASWRVHCRGALRRAERDVPAAREDLRALRARFGASLPVAAAYGETSAMGVDYGPAFQGLVELWSGDGEALGRVRLPEAAGSDAAYRMHPALLDACLQVMIGASPRGGEATPWVPVALGSLRVLQRPIGELWCHGRSVREGPQAADRRTADVRMMDSTGALVAEISGIVVQRLADGARRREEDDWFLDLDWERAAVPAPKLTAGRWLLLGGGRELGAALGSALQAAGHAVKHAAAIETSAAGVRALLAGAFGGQAPTAVVHLGSLDGEGKLEAEAVESALVRGCDSVLATVQALAAMSYRDAPRLWLLTRGAQAVGVGEVAVAQAPVLGLGRSIALEHADLRCTRLDLDPARPEGEVERLLTELLADDAEDEVALRGGERHVARLVRRAPEAERRERVEPAGGRAFRLEMEKSGVLDDLVLRAAERRSPGPGEVEIAVEAAGLNLPDVLLALGVIPNDAPGASEGPIVLGGECTGRIVALGQGVSGLAVGQAVFAPARGAFGTHVTTSAALVLPRPPGLSATEAAAFASVNLTAWYALSEVARLQRGERVLIHAATGGVGLAALQWAQHVGAEIYATAGTPEKRAYLASLGVRYVSDSRSDQFVSDVLAWTNGEGVDVVLNSLSGDLIAKSFALLRSHGRFVELGKRDYYADNQLGLRPFLRNLSFSLVDLRGMSIERPAWVRALLEEMLGLFAAGALRTPPVEAFPISRAADAFRKMAQGQHIGKLVLTLDDPEARILVRKEPGVAIRRDGSYLVTGGLGGLGLSVAGWLAKQGAGHLVLMGRSGAASPEQQAAVAALEAQGARVTVAKADVADRAQVARALGEITASGMPLRGVIHAAGVLHDGVLIHQTPTRFRTVMAPKAQGALHLHTLTRGMPLDFFVLYASGSGLLGSAAQGNHAAANTFLDALAHHRRREGLPALSIDWGGFSEVGQAATQKNLARLASRGMRSLTLEEGLSALARLLEGDRAQVGVLPINVRQWVEFQPTLASWRMLSRLLAEQDVGAGRSAGDSDLLERLAAGEPAERTALLQGALRTLVSHVLRIPESKLDVSAPLTSLGMDSLMGLELRNRIEAALGITVPATLLWTYPTIAALSAHLEKEARGAAPPEPPQINPDPAADVEEMSQDELERLIDAKYEIFA